LKVEERKNLGKKKVRRINQKGKSGCPTVSLRLEKEGLAESSWGSPS